VTDRVRVQELAHGALASLEANRQRIDDLNVYPVPDGDTGTNLTMTARSVVDELDRTTTEDRAGLVKEVTRAALMGARGNSGVILSQIIRGAAETLRANGEVDAHTVAAAFRSASDAAYRAVRQPVEGTMLSVIREMAEEGENAESDGLTKEELLIRLVRRGEEAVARTPEQPVCSRSCAGWLPRPPESRCRRRRRSARKSPSKRFTRISRPTGTARRS